MSAFSFISSLELGLIFAILALGLFVAFRILNLPDLTVDGSFVTGVAICGMSCLNGHYILGLFLALIGGALAGLITGLIHTKLKVEPILAGILTMTALYSINLRIMDLKPSIFFFDKKTIFSFLEGKIIINNYDYSKLIILIVIVSLVILLLTWFLKTKTGLTLNATGDNPKMVKNSSIDTDKMKIIGFALTNAIVAFSGAIYIQYTSQASQSIGIGMLVLGLASIIIGEGIFRSKGLFKTILAVTFGAIIYRLLLTLAFSIGLPPTDLKLFSALIVTIALGIPLIKPKIIKWRKKNAINKKC